jgi:hypothetical protein
VPKSKLKGLKIGRTRLKPTHGRPQKKKIIKNLDQRFLFINKK